MCPKDEASGATVVNSPPVQCDIGRTLFEDERLNARFASDVSTSATDEMCSGPSLPLRGPIFHFLMSWFDHHLSAVITVLMTMSGPGRAQQRLPRTSAGSRSTRKMRPLRHSFLFSIAAITEASSHSCAPTISIRLG